MIFGNAFADETVRIAPPATVTGLTLFGVQLPDLVLLLTAIYTIIQIVNALRRAYAGETSCKDNCPLKNINSDDDGNE